MLPLKFSFKKKSLDKISFKNTLFVNNFLSLRLSNEEVILKLKGSKYIFPEKVNLSLPIKELFETKLICLLSRL